MKRRWLSPSATPATNSRGVPAPHLNQARHQRQPSAISAACHARVEVDVTKYHACHVKRRWMSPSATPATNSRGVPAPHLKPSAPPEAAQCHKCRLPRQSRSRCHQVPRLPRETKMDVSKCHAGNANSRGVPAPHLKPSAPPEPAQCHKCHACHARVELHVTKYHACQVKRKPTAPE